MLNEFQTGSVNLNRNGNRNGNFNDQNANVKRTRACMIGNETNIDTSGVKEIMEDLFHYVTRQITKASGNSTRATCGIAGVTPPSEGVPRRNQSRNQNRNQNQTENNNNNNGVNTKENCVFLCPLTPISSTMCGSILHDVFVSNSSLNDDNDELSQELFNKLGFCGGFKSFKTLFIDYLKNINVIEVGDNGDSDGDKDSNYQLSELFMSKLD